VNAVVEVSQNGPVQCSMQSDSGNRLQAGREQYSTKRRGVVVNNGRTNERLA
jgi:hypothetical protein